MTRLMLCGPMRGMQFYNVITRDARINVRLDSDLREWLDGLARNRHVEVSDVVRDILYEAKQGPPKTGKPSFVPYGVQVVQVHNGKGHQTARVKKAAKQ